MKVRELIVLLAHCDENKEVFYRGPITDESVFEIVEENDRVIIE